MMPSMKTSLSGSFVTVPSGPPGLPGLAGPSGLAASAGSADISGHVRAFEDYARAYRTGEAGHDFHLDLKAGHSMNVLRHARDMAAAERVFADDPVLARAFLLCALYHDLGRFEQFARFGTFNDKTSVNHGRLSARELLRTGLLKGESARVRRLVLAGAALHNRFALPAGLTQDFRAVAGAVRDADKLDIMRIMASHLTSGADADPVVLLHVKSSAEASPAVLAAVMARRPALYTDMATTTDFALLVCAWIYDLNYPWSRRAAARSEHLAAIVDSLPRTPELGGFFTQYEKDLACHAE